MEDNYEKLKTINELREKINTTSSYILYGVGRVTYALLLYLSRQSNELAKIYCIAVTDSTNAPDSIMGIPVCELNDIHPEQFDLVIISTFEKSQKSIAANLYHYGFDSFCMISNVLYADLRRECGNFDVDILNNTQWIKDDIFRLRQETRDRQNAIISKIDGIQSEVFKIRACMEHGVRHYDELIPTKQYPKELAKWYKRQTGVDLNIEHPKTFNEKIQWIKLYGTTPQMTKLADKYAVREWVSQRIGSEYLIPLLGVWDEFQDINFEELPKQFVLKCTHGAEMNEIVMDKDTLSTALLRRKFNRWLETNYAFRGGLQLQYKNIIPRIIAEKYLENSEGDLFDYKFWCFGGKCEFVMFLSERGTGLKMDNFDKDWNHLPFTYNYPNSGKVIPKPQKLSEMLNIAEELSKGFPFVRVDLYQLNDGTIKFGEMTFTPLSGACRWSDEIINSKLGEMIIIPETSGQSPY